MYTDRHHRLELERQPISAGRIANTTAPFRKPHPSPASPPPWWRAWSPDFALAFAAIVVIVLMTVALTLVFGP